jgi:hypothetical protein
MSAVKIVTIGKKINLYKGEDLAERIELVIPEENGFEIVAQKGLYQLGDKAIFIEPDYCLSDNPVFDSYTKPGGDVTKSKLGKVGGERRRIRALKFNLSKEQNGDPIFSYGILIPISDLDFKIDGNTDLEKLLGVFKYVEPDTTKGGFSDGFNFPEGIYKTDEDNIYNVKNKINFPIKLVGRLKEDGSSITIGKIDNELFIGSRKIRKPIYLKQVVGKRYKTLVEKLMFWKKPDLRIIEEKLNDDPFVKNGMKILEKLNCEYDFLLRGEISGGGMKGSGNKNNPANNKPVQIKFFGLDFMFNGYSIKQNNIRLEKFCEKYEFNTCEKIFEKEFNSFDELINECNTYFKENLVEGIVVRTLDSSFSAKVMNLQYDSLK